MGRRLLNIAVVSALLAIGSSAAAAKPDPFEAHPHDEQGEPLPLPPAPAPDQRSSHLEFGLTAAWAGAFGTLESNVGVPQALSAGPRLAFDASYGLSRSFSLGLWGEFASFADGRCTSCSGRSYAGGPLFKHHLVQGLRLDSWVSIGFGVRSLTISTAGADLSYTALDWLRLEVGADWYATDKLVVGPALGLDFSSFLDRPASSAPLIGRRFDGGRVGLALQPWAGLRFGFDWPGR